MCLNITSIKNIQTPSQLAPKDSFLKYTIPYKMIYRNSVRYTTAHSVSKLKWLLIPEACTTEQVSYLANANASWLTDQ